MLPELTRGRDAARERHPLPTSSSPSSVLPAYSLRDKHSSLEDFVFYSRLYCGGSELTAVEVLLDAGVSEETSCSSTCSPARKGVSTVCQGHPELNIVSSSSEERFNEHTYMMAGIGDFGDRCDGNLDLGAAK
jgi:uracil phosphoribosyltransferase